MNRRLMMQRRKLKANEEYLKSRSSQEMKDQKGPRPSDASSKSAATGVLKPATTTQTATRLQGAKALPSKKKEESSSKSSLGFSSSHISIDSEKLRSKFLDHPQRKPAPSKKRARIERQDSSSSSSSSSTLFKSTDKKKKHHYHQPLTFTSKKQQRKLDLLSSSKTASRRSYNSSSSSSSSSDEDDFRSKVSAAFRKLQPTGTKEESVENSKENQPSRFISKSLDTQSRPKTPPHASSDTSTQTKTPQNESSSASSQPPHVNNHKEVSTISSLYSKGNDGASCLVKSYPDCSSTDVVMEEEKKDEDDQEEHAGPSCSAASPVKDSSSSPQQKATKPRESRTMVQKKKRKGSNKKWKNRGGGSSSSYAYRSVYKEDTERQKLLELGPDELEQRLHPTFDQPKFGPFAEEPLVLNGANGWSHQVPASISRYLPDYQREGIEFLYKVMSSGKGAILGDDMGLGKTIQVAALLTALYRKTGTGADLMELAYRRQIMGSKLEEDQKRRELELLQGTNSSIVEESMKVDSPDLGVSEWAPTLLVVPSSVRENWANELKTWAHFDVAIFWGKEKDSVIAAARAGMVEIVIASENTVKKKADSNPDFEKFMSVPWKLIVIDEMHKFKNPKSNGTLNLRQLKRNYGSVIVGLTGTAMQNNHNELWTLIDLVQPNHFGSWDDFEDLISRPMRMGRSKGADEYEINAANAASSVLKERLDQVYLARTKEEKLAEMLPDKQENVVLCELSDLQTTVYKNILTLPEYEAMRKAKEPCDCQVNWRHFQRFNQLQTTGEQLEYLQRNKELILRRFQCCHGENELKENPDKAVIYNSISDHNHEFPIDCPFCCSLPAMDKLIKLCSHASLLQPKRVADPIGSEEHNNYLKGLAFAKVAFPPDTVKHLAGGTLDREDGIMDEHFQLSGKLKHMSKLLKRFANSNDGSKVLIFSYSTQTLDLIQNYMRGKYEFRRMDGTTDVTERQGRADEFNNDPNIFAFLLSTKAMGLGLNLASANKVIIFDCDWNPSWDAQAQDRAYRIGQKRDVEVFRLVAKGTLEEIRFLRQLYKQQLTLETVKYDADEPDRFRLFDGIQADFDAIWKADAYRGEAGEIFGMENLLKLKEGAFLHEIWKKNGVDPEEQDEDGHILETSKVTDILKSIEADRCDEKLDTGETEELRKFREVASKVAQSWKGTANDLDENSQWVENHPAPVYKDAYAPDDMMSEDDNSMDSPSMGEEVSRPVELLYNSSTRSKESAFSASPHVFDGKELNQEPEVALPSPVRSQVVPGNVSSLPRFPDGSEANPEEPAHCSSGIDGAIPSPILSNRSRLPEPVVSGNHGSTGYQPMVRDHISSGVSKDHKPDIVLLVGIPGSGKTTFANQLVSSGWNRISQDDLGSRQECEVMAQEFLESGKRIVLDRCNVQASDRLCWLTKFRKVPGERKYAAAVYFESDPDLCIERVEARENHPTISGSKKANARQIVMSLFDRLDPPKESEDGIDKVYNVQSFEEANQLLKILGNMSTG